MKDPKNFIKLQKEKLDVNALVALVTSPSCGAITNFIGTTRDNFENKKVVKLEYEAYEPMALKELNNICTEIRSKWSVENIAIYHRLGEVPVSEASVIIAISSPHRKESLEAVQFAIDSLKSSVPIWKKEVYDTEEFEWKENKECTWAKTKDEENEKNESPNVTIDQNLVQIKADNDELNRRIESFITRKRQQVNVVNVQEFCCRRDPSEEGEGSCARVDAILIRNKDSKSHVKVHRVMNLWGPQTVDASKLHQKNLPADCSSDNMENYSSVLDERIWASEKVLGITKPVPRDIYERLKNIEDRILELESISPEYKEFWVAKTDDDSNIYYKPMRKRTFSAAELDSKLHELENKYVKKMK